MKWLVTSLVQLLLTFFLYAIGILVIGTALYPGLSLCFFAWSATAAGPAGIRILVLGLALAGAYFVTGICLIAITGSIRILFRLRLNEGIYPLNSPGAFKWALTNSLMILVWNIFGDFILLTPFASIFYRLMGARLGKNVQINSKFGADLSLLEVGDETVIGGHATVICHSVERGRLVLKKVRIGKRVTIGLNSVILPGAQIGDGAVIAAGAVLTKDAKVEPHSVFVGVPAVSAKERHENKG
ncbi:MAG: DapH/DapD/GlmU-related protein [Candidatus Omnitrophica bacterium]|nr:DapH/DapD/GlmU-related protein [Candidatus Omnitrophota bacterium]MDD5670729.1 DapH/DapD/GlmU-related protein [Candidatus Omnitrophota bacterium]